jgi:hypothetical protein
MSEILTIKPHGKYRYTSDFVFIVEPEIKEAATKKTSISDNSPRLYIRKDECDFIMQNRPINHINYTPLKKLIENGFIEIDKEEPEIHLKFDGGIDENADKIKKNFSYYKYKFYRTLKDDMYGKEDDEILDKNLLNENDCLGFSECMTVANYKPDKALFDRMIGVIDVTSQEELKKGKGGIEPALQVKGTMDIFGVKNSKNIKLAKQFPEDNKNYKANPAVAESYAIVNYDKKDGDDLTPYHIAFVICKDNNLNITIEAFADSATDYEVKFSIYDTIEKRFTFQETHSEYFGKDTESETIVLESRDLNDPKTGLSKIEADIEQRAKELKDKKEAETVKLPTKTPVRTPKKTSIIRPPKSIKITQTPLAMNPKKRLASVSASRNASVHKSARKSLKPSMSKKENTNTNTRRKSRYN